MSSIFDGIADAGRSEEIASLAIGKVKENWDEKHPGMVKVEYFLGTTGKNVSAWVPVVVPYAGNGYGEYFLPEIGSTVVLGFNMGDRNMPIVLGCLWNDVNKLPASTAAKENPKKRLKTKGGNEVLLTDEKKKESIEVHTPGELKVKMTDETQKITITDKNSKNLLEIKAKDGHVRLAAASKITLECGGTAVTIDGKAKKMTLSMNQIEIKGSQTVKINGQSTNISGSMVEVKGSAQLKMDGGGMAQLKAGMVKIN